MTTQTIDRVEPLPADRLADDVLDFDHYVCCDVNMALCGTDVTDVPWTEIVKLCPMCAVTKTCPKCGARH